MTWGPYFLFIDTGVELLAELRIESDLQIPLRLALDMVHSSLPLHSDTCHLPTEQRHRDLEHGGQTCARLLTPSYNTLFLKLLQSDQGLETWIEVQETDVQI